MYTLLVLGCDDMSLISARAEDPFRLESIQMGVGDRPENHHTCVTIAKVKASTQLPSFGT